MKTSIAPRLNYCADSEGRYALIIQVIHDRRRSILTTPYRLYPDEFDRKKCRAIPTNRTKAHRNMIREANESIATYLSALSLLADKLKKTGAPYTAQSITDLYKCNSDYHYLTTFAEKLIADLETTGRFGTARTYRSLMRAWGKFAPNTRYRFSQLDSRTITAFGDYLEQHGNQRNTVSFYLRTLRALYNRARKYGYAPEGHNPFREVSFKPAKTPKLAVTRELLNTLAVTDFKDALLNEARDMFLFSFYARGMSFVDMAYLEKDKIWDGALHYRRHKNNIKQMVKEKTGRAMQEKERERKGKNGKIIKVAGCSPIREGVLLIRPDTTLADVRKFGEECQRRWGITPLQIFLHKDEGHWLNGQPEAEDRESFKVGNRWFKPNYHAHIVFDWMNHETGKSRKLNDEDMAAMQTLASNILLMERGQAKAVTGKEHLERNDFIIKKQKAELQRIEETKRHKEQQVSLAEQELKQVKAEIRTDKLKSAATDVATAITSGVGSLFGSGKLKDLEQSNENLRHEIAKRDKGIDELKAKMQQMQEQHSKQIRNLQGIHNQELEAKDKEISRLNAILEKAFNWFPLLKEMLRMEKLCYAIGFTKDMINSLLTKKEAIRCNGRIYSEEHKRKFDIKNDIFKVEKNPTDDSKLILTINRQPIGEWFKEQWEKLRQGLRQLAEEPRKSRGFRM